MYILGEGGGEDVYVGVHGLISVVSVGLFWPMLSGMATAAFAVSLQTRAEEGSTVLLS